MDKWINIIPEILHRVETNNILLHATMGVTFKSVNKWEKQIAEGEST